jgi:hypothetical protein
MIFRELQASIAHSGYQTTAGARLVDGNLQVRYNCLVELHPFASRLSATREGRLPASALSLYDTNQVKK